MEMNKPLSVDDPWRLLASLRELVAQRTPAERKLPAEFAANDEAIKKRHQEAWERLVAEYEERKQTVESEHASTRRTVIAEFGVKHRATQKEYDDLRRQTIARYKNAEREQAQKRQDSHWEATTVFEATKGRPDAERKEIEERLSAVRSELEALGQDAARLLSRRRQWREYAEPTTARGDASPEPLAQTAELLALARDQWRQLHYQPIPGLFEGARPLGVLLLLWLLMVYPFGATLGWQTWYWSAASGAVALGLWAAIGSWLYGIAKRQSTEGYLAL